jgi:hypothetical protein
MGTRPYRLDPLNTSGIKYFYEVLEHEHHVCASRRFLCLQSSMFVRLMQPAIYLRGGKATNL